MELKQFRDETANGLPAALTADDLGKTLAANETLKMLLTHLCLVVQLVLLFQVRAAQQKGAFRPSGG